MRSHASATQNLHALSTQPIRETDRHDRLSATAKFLAEQLPLESHNILKQLISTTKPELFKLRTLLITNGIISSKALNSLNANIKLTAYERQIENSFFFAEETKPIRYEIVQPMDNAKRILTDIYREKYGLDLFVETVTLGIEELSELLTRKLKSSGTTPFGMILHSPPNILHNRAFAELDGNYSGHVTPFVLQNTSDGFDVICLDSVNQPDERLFHCCKPFAEQGYNIRTMTTAGIRQTDGYSCHTDALQTLKDLILKYKNRECNLLDSLKSGSEEMPSTLNPIASTLPKTLALGNYGTLQKTNQTDRSKTMNPKYTAKFDGAPEKFSPTNHFLLIKGYYNALKVLHHSRKKA